MITYQEFTNIDIRAGTILRAEIFPEARQPAYKIWIDFGHEIGEKKSSAQITHLYKLKDLVGKQVLAVVNFTPKQVGSFMSEVLILGLSNEAGQIVLVSPDSPSPNGARLH